MDNGKKVLYSIGIDGDEIGGESALQRQRRPRKNPSQPPSQPERDDRSGNEDEIRNLQNEAMEMKRMISDLQRGLSESIGMKDHIERIEAENRAEHDVFRSSIDGFQKKLGDFQAMSGKVEDLTSKSWQAAQSFEKIETFMNHTEQKFQMVEQKLNKAEEYVITYLRNLDVWVQQLKKQLDNVIEMFNNHIFMYHQQNPVYPQPPPPQQYFVDEAGNYHPIPPNPQNFPPNPQNFPPNPQNFPPNYQNFPQNYQGECSLQGNKADDVTEGRLRLISELKSISSHLENFKRMALNKKPGRK
eukprot:549722-Hanusia_phi.AAC.2